MSSRTFSLCTPLLALAALTACQSGLGQGPLDGRVYQVTLDNPKEAPQPDQLVFDGGRFESTACRNHGFTTAPYSASTEGAASSFEASAKCPKAGATAWTGSIRGDAIEGKLVFTNPKGEQSEYRFTGTKLSGPLDGRVFEGQICEGDSTSGDKDRLTFANGAFDSSACRGYGFTMAPYVAKQDGASTRFTAEAINASGDKNRWEGVVQGDDVSGTMQHMNPSGKVTDSYRFVAKLVK